ncbi:MAG: hypothetical protein WEC84_03435 [Candidatus Andersenbacteria bacterium]
MFLPIRERTDCYTRLALCDARGPLNDLLEKLSGENGSLWLADLNQLLRQPRPTSTKPPVKLRKASGRSRAQAEESHVIDCDNLPWITSNFKRVQWSQKGKFAWDPKRAKLYLPASQETKAYKGHELKDELQNLPIMGVAVRDFLLSHPELIPEEWKDYYILFWRTVYVDLQDHLWIPSLVYYKEGWHENFKSLECDSLFSGNYRTLLYEP